MYFLLIVLAIIIFLISWFAYGNLYYDRRIMNKVFKYYCERQVILDNGLCLNYAVVENNLPPLLLIHGQTMCWEDYARVLLELKEHFNVYVIDCHGHGKSSHHPTRYSCKDMGEDIKWFIENIINEACIVSGHSSGGIIAAWLGVHAKSMISGVVFEDPPFFKVLPEEMLNTFVWKDGFEVIHNYLVEESEEDYDLYYLLNGYFWNLFGDLRLFVNKSAKKYRRKNPDGPLKLWYIPYKWLHGTRYLNSFDLNFAETFYNGSWFESIDYKALLPLIECPILYLKAKTIYGKDGVLYAANTDEDAKQVAELVNNCQMITIKSGHDIHFVHPKVFVKSILRFSRGIN